MASSVPLYRYDVFISYSHADRAWVQTWLLPQLEAAGLRACIDDRDFAIGRPSIVNMEDAIIQSRHTVIVLTPAWVNSQWTAFEALLTQTSDPAGSQQRLLPLLLEPCQPPPRIAYLSYLDFTDSQQHTRQLRRLIDTLQGRARPADLGQTLQHLLPDRLLTPDERNRRAMLHKVRRIWIVDVLQHSLYQEVLITLGLRTRPDAVARPMDVLVQRPNRAEQPLPPDKHIIDVYDELQGALLILGAPGAGKTTLLLDLTRELLDRADHDPHHPIPVVFPLSSWAERRLPLMEWLVDELNKRYDVPRKVAQSWVTVDHILPLLDGLDEVNADVRAACAEAINTYSQEHGLLPLVVSSRIADYDALTVKLRLEGAIVAQPLIREQVEDYLQRIGLPAVPSNTSLLWELFDTPLMINIATLAYADQPEAALQTTGTVEQRRDQIFAAYIERMFQRNSPQLHFSQHQTVQWLSWLAWQMQQHSQTVFYLEHMQPSWLPRHQGWLTILSAELLVGLIFGPLFGLVFGLAFGPVGLFLGLIAGLWLGLYLRRNSGYSKEIKIVEVVRWSWSQFRVGLRSSVSNGVGGGLGIGILYGLGGEHLTQWSTWTIRQVFAAFPRDEVVDPLVMLITILITGLGKGFRGGIIVGVVLGLIATLATGIFRGLASAEIPTKAMPNEGIWRSAKNALIFGLFYSLAGFVVVGLGVGLLSGWSIGLAWGQFYAQSWGWSLGLLGGLSGGVVAGLFAVLHYGGRACLQHLVLRCFLVRNGYASWHYIQFLNFAAQRIFLRKVGGGYIFIHRLLLDYFAAQYTGPETAEVNAPSNGT